VEKAVVELSTPETGAGALFPGDKKQKSETVTSNSQGIAKFSLLRANQIPGDYKLPVIARFNGVSGSVSVPATNTPVPLLTKKRWTLIVIGCGAGVIAALALRPKSVPSATVSTVSPTGPVGKP
jgi:hypothetical protein